MDFLELAKERYSVRKYNGEKVEDDKLARILEAGRVAPTAANFQPQRFLVIYSGEGLAKLAKAANLHGAPCAIVALSRKDKAWVRPQDGHSMADIDAAIATTHMMLEAWAEGVASCWITWFDPAVVKSEFALPDLIEPINILALGYAAGEKPLSERHEKARIPLENMVWYESVPEDYL